MYCLIMGGWEEVYKEFHITQRDSAVIDISRMKDPTLPDAEVALRFLSEFLRLGGISRCFSTLWFSEI